MSDICEREIILESSRGGDAAVLVEPASSAPTAAVLVVPGLIAAGGGPGAGEPGPVANDGAANLYAGVARGLAGRGHAVVRLRRAGRGVERAAVDATGAMRSHSFDARVGRAGEALAELRRRAPAAPIVLLGHGDGAVVAALLASGGTEAAGLVTLSSPSVRVFDLLRERLPLPVPPGDAAAAYAAFDTVVARLRSGLGLQRTAAMHPTTAPFARLDPAVLAYLTSADEVDTGRVLAAVPCPVLIMHGGRDGYIGEYHAHRLAESRGERPTQVALFPQLHHFYERVETGRSVRASRRTEVSVDPAVLDRIDGWIRGLGE